MNDTIKNFIRKFTGDIEFSDNDNIFEKKLVNSLFAMQLISFLESEFDITVENDDMEIENFASVNSISKFLLSKKTD